MTNASFTESFMYRNGRVEDFDGIRVTYGLVFGQPDLTETPSADPTEEPILVKLRART